MNSTTRNVRKLFISVKYNKSTQNYKSVLALRAETLCPATGYLSSGLLSQCLDVIPGKEEKERDDSREWSSDVASNLSMAVKTTQTPQSACVAQRSSPAPSSHWEGRRMTTLQPACC